MILNHFNRTGLFALTMTGLVVVGCGKKKETETVYVPAPTSPAPAQPVAVNNSGTSPTNTEANSSNQPLGISEALAVDIKNRASIEGKVLPAGSVSLEFGLVNATNLVKDIGFKCKLEQKAVKNLGLTEDCSSPKSYQIQDAGQYVVTIFAVLTGTSVAGAPTQIEFSVSDASGSIGGGNGNGSGNGTGNGSAGGGFGDCQPSAGIPCATQDADGSYADAIQAVQVGDMFSVNIPQGFHMVYRTSTFDTPGFLNFQYINGGKSRDAAAPYAYRCSENDGNNFQTIEQLVMPSGRTLEYCNMTPSIAFNAPSDPIFNSFRWMNMNTISYNSLALATDTSLVGFRGTAAARPMMAKLYTNIFTNVTGRSGSQFQHMFATELNQTVSRMNIACAGQQPQYLGNAAIFQDYFQWNPASSPLFGCVTPRNNQWYVQIGAFPIDQNMPILPGTGWSPWISQSFANVRAAEIVVEVGPFPYAPAPISVAPDAQALMIQNIKKLLPSVSQPPVAVTPCLTGCNGGGSGWRFPWNR